MSLASKISGTYHTPTPGSKSRTYTIHVEDQVLIATTAGRERIKLNTLFPNVEDYIQKIIDHIAGKKEVGLPIGSVHAKPQSGTLEGFLQTLSTSGGLGSYVAPILEKHFGMEYFIPTGRRGVWIRQK